MVTLEALKEITEKSKENKQIFCEKVIQDLFLDFKSKIEERLVKEAKDGKSSLEIFRLKASHCSKEELKDFYFLLNSNAENRWLYEKEFLSNFPLNKLIFDYIKEIGLNINIYFHFYDHNVHSEYIINDDTYLTIKISWN